MDSIQPVAGEKPGHLRLFFRELGPGLITGAADDDPSGISTYSVAGAAFGYTGLWTALFSFPLMSAVQLMCARLGMVSGRGLAGVIRTRYSAWILWPACALLIVANVFNIGADLGGMADAMQMVTGLRAYFWTPVFAGLIIALLFRTSYRSMARVLKWLTLVLFAYVITAFLAKPDWAAVAHATFIPHVEWTKPIWPYWWGFWERPSRPISFSGKPLKKWKKNAKWVATPWPNGAELRMRNYAWRRRMCSPEWEYPTW